MEHILHSHIMKHLERHGILGYSQHGFRSRRSTETQLGYTFHDIAKALDTNVSISLAIPVFSKAFSRPPVTETALLWYPWPYIALDQMFPY